MWTWKKRIECMMEAIEEVRDNRIISRHNSAECHFLLTQKLMEKKVVRNKLDMERAAYFLTEKGLLYAENFAKLYKDLHTPKVV
jgi:predicted transcriptional regulator